MMKTFLLFLALLLTLVMPVGAQDQGKPGEDAGQSGMPKPLDDAMSKWMVGDWSGSNESNMGTAKESEKCELSLDKQFVVMHLTSQFTKMNPDFLKATASAMKMSEKDAEGILKGSIYKGMGLMTTDPKTGDYVGYWFDSMRGMYKGTGKLEGNKITMNWEGTMGASVRTIEKDEKGNMVQTFKQSMNGNTDEGKSVYSRKKK